EPEQQRQRRAFDISVEHAPRVTRTRAPGEARCCERSSPCNERRARRRAPRRNVAILRAVFRRLLVALVACSLLALLSTAEYCFWLHVVGRPVAKAIVPALLRDGLPWLLWALCVPLAIAWGERFVLTWPPRATTVLAHVAGAAGAIVLFA